MTFQPRDDALSWGRVIRRKQQVASPRFRDNLLGLISGQWPGTVLPVGLRRSYGDSVLNSEGRVISMTGLDRFVALDLETGMLRAEAGVTLSGIMRRVVPHGFFLPCHARNALRDAWRRNRQRCPWQESPSRRNIRPACVVLRPAPPRWGGDCRYAAGQRRPF